jgi:hypothetical protein
MSGTPLDSPSAIYRPFSADEAVQLRGFVDAVRSLGGMRFFAQVPQQATMSWKPDGGFSAEMDEPDDEALRAAITQFRQIYSPDEPHSFHRAIKVLKRSVHERGSELRDAALADLDGHVQAERDTLRQGGAMKLVFETPEGSRPIDSKTIIDAYFHGQYLHSGNRKSELARRLDELQPWPRYTLYTVMLGLRNVYWVAANAAQRALDVPDLVKAETT